MSKFAAALATAGALAAAPVLAGPVTDRPVTYHSVQIEGLEIFYREAGPADAPAILLLHGFPSSSHMFRDLIPLLATRYHVIAPDYPGFGYSSAPAPEAFDYSFDHLAQVVDALTQEIGLGSYVLYMQDYGGPVGFRLATAHPERVRGLVVQNAVASVEGWYPEIVKQLAPVWQNRTPETEQPLRDLLKVTEFQYRQGSSLPDRLNPDAWTFDQALLDRPGNDRIQVELLYRYQDNVALYPAWQAWLKETQPPILVTWGDGDPFFTPAGRDLFQALVPATRTVSYPAGHFALETHGAEIAAEILAFLDTLPR